MKAEIVSSISAFSKINREQAFMQVLLPYVSLIITNI